MLYWIFSGGTAAPAQAVHNLQAQANFNILRIFQAAPDKLITKIDVLSLTKIT